MEYLSKIYTILKYKFSLISCEDVDGDLRNTLSYEIICFKGSHFYFAFFIAAPVIVLFGLGLPLAAAYLLRTNKN